LKESSPASASLLAIASFWNKSLTLQEAKDGAVTT